VRRVATFAAVPVPTAQLRVFVPLDGFPAPIRRRWEAVVLGGTGVTRAQAADAARRLDRAVQFGGALPGGDLALVRRVSGAPYVCPLDLPLRAARAFAELEEDLPDVVVQALVPDPAMRHRLRSLARTRRLPHVRDHAFGVPVAWYAPFAPTDQRRSDPGTGPRSRLITRVGRAVDRLVTAFTALAPVAPDEDLDTLEDLADWLAAYPESALLELDAGALARRLPASQDRVALDLADALDAAGRGDLLEAAAAMATARARWATSLHQPDHC
jgi:hypothetical protein